MRRQEERPVRAAGVRAYKVRNIACYRTYLLTEHLYCRYDRVRRAQQQGVSTRNDLHKNPDARAEDEKVALPFPEWLLNFDAEQNAVDLYEEVAACILTEGYQRPSEFVVPCCKSV